MNKLLCKLLVVATCFYIASSTVSANNMLDIFDQSGDPKKGKINGVEFMSAREDDILTLVLFDNESSANNNYWFLRCHSYKNEYSMDEVICGAQRDEFTIILNSLGYAIEMESKPKGDGRYMIAFDKNASFASTYRIIQKDKVKDFLNKMIHSEKMQYSYKNEKNKYVSRELLIKNTNLAISLLQDMRDYY